MKHTEKAFIPMNIGKRHGKPWFAVAELNWTASGARKGMTKHDPRGHHEAWRLLRKDGWRIVRVKVSMS